MYRSLDCRGLQGAGIGSSLPAILALFRAEDNSLQALVEPDAVHCGSCKPRGRPVRLDGLEAWMAPEK